MFKKEPPVNSLEANSQTGLSSKKNNLWLMLGGVLVVIMVLVSGFFIIYKQKNSNQNVAPTAPESRPQAAIPESNICNLEVVVIPPSPTPTGEINDVICAGAKITPKPAIDGQLVTYTGGTKQLKLEGGAIRTHMRYLKDGKEKQFPDTEGKDRTTTASAELADKIHFANIISKEIDGIQRDCVFDTTPIWDERIKRPIKTGVWTWIDPETGKEKQAKIVENWRCVNSCYALTDVILPGATPTATPSATPTASPSATPTATPTGTLTPTPTTIYSCNSDCTLDSQCQTANADYICSVEEGNKCRLASNPTSETCQPKEQTYSCNSSCETDAQCQTANVNYICSSEYGNVCRLASNPSANNCQPPVYATPTPVPGCNDICSTNADCTVANPNYFCFQTPDGTNRCRLDAYPNSDTCTAPQESVVVPPTQVAQQPTPQPTLPPQLPETGASDWFTWMKVGLATVGVGAALLLLL